MIGIARWYQRVKNAIHAVQALIIFIAWAIAIALFTQKARKDGRVYYYFALVHSPPSRETLSSHKLIKAIVLGFHSCSHLPDRHTRLLPHKTFLQSLRSRHRRRPVPNSLVRGDDSDGSMGQGKLAYETVDEWEQQAGPGCLGAGAHHLVRQPPSSPSSTTAINEEMSHSLLFANTTAFSMWGAKYYRKNGELPSYEIKDTEPLPVKDRTNYSFIPNPNDKLGEYDPTHPEPGDEESTALRTNNTAITAAHLAVPTTSPTQGGFSPIDTSYHGGGSFYDQPPQPSHRFSSPRYETLHSNESDYIGGMELKPLPLDIRRR